VIHADHGAGAAAGADDAAAGRGGDLPGAGLATGYRFAIEEYLAAPTDTGTIEVHCLPQPVVFAIAAACGCVPLEVREDTAMGPPSAWLSNRYVFTKPG
jgi:hypothetical protein